MLIQSVSPLFRIFSVPCIIWLGLSLYACQGSETHTHKTNQPMQAEQRADQLIIKAWEHESTITQVLQDLSQQFHAQLRGLEHRLKTRSSTIRKLKKIMQEKSHKDASGLVISDVLRYTFEIKDEPAGHYVSSIRKILAALNKKGYTAKKVKNYWPKGDNYSGVNMILMDTHNFEWELQVHTPESFAEAKRSHDEYEKLRALDTSLAEKQALFDKMAAPWETITVPKDVLVPQSLHKIEVIKQGKRPGGEKNKNTKTDSNTKQDNQANTPSSTPSK